MAVLAGLLVHIGAKLVNVAHVRELHRHGELPVYVVTILGVVLVDLLTGVLLGLGRHRVGERPGRGGRFVSGFVSGS